LPASTSQPVRNPLQGGHGHLRDFMHHGIVFGCIEPEQAGRRQGGGAVCVVLLPQRRQGAKKVARGEQVDQGLAPIGRKARGFDGTGRHHVKMRRGIALHVDRRSGVKALRPAMPVDLRQLLRVEFGKERYFLADGEAHGQRAGLRVGIRQGQWNVATLVHGLYFLLLPKGSWSYAEA